MFFTLRRLRHTTSFFAEIPRVDWGCTTHLPFSLKIHELALFLAEVAPPTFLFHWKSMSRHLYLWHCATQLLYLLQTTWLGDNGIASKGIPHGSTWAKTWAKTQTTVAMKREQSECQLHSSGTLLPFPNATSVWPMTLSWYDKVFILQSCVEYKVLNNFHSIQLGIGVSFSISITCSHSRTNNLTVLCSVSLHVLIG